MSVLDAAAPGRTETRARQEAATPPSAGGVIVYRRDFLPRSETFVLDHIEHLRRWRPVPVCDRRISGGLEVGALAPVVLEGDRPSRWRRQFLGSSPALEELVRRRGVGLIHAHFLNDGARIAAFARRSGAPLVVTAHGYDATLNLAARLEHYDHRFALLMQRRLIEAASRIVCVSDFIRGELLRRGFPERKLVTLRLGVDLQQLAQGGPASGREGALFVGRLVEKKGLGHLLRAWAKLPPELRRQPLRIVGDGPLRSEMEALAGSLPAPIRFMGAQPREAVLTLMRSSRVFVLPSLRASNGDAEGCPVVLMEAQALGAPVIAFDGAHGPEAMQRDVSGLLAPPGDVDALAGALARVLGDDALADRLGAAGPAVAAERFDLRRNVAALERLYDEVVAEHAAGRGRG